MGIEIRDVDGQHYVKIPFALKDSFRAAMPSAKWHPDTKFWSVGPRALTRLKQWIEAVEPAVEAIAQATESAMTAEELAQVRAQATALRSEIEAARSKTMALSEVAAALQAAQGELAEVRAKVSAEKIAQREAKAQVVAALAGIIDVGIIDAALREMRRVHNAVGAQARGAFDAAQERVRAQHIRLKEAGFLCPLLACIASANFNRPERDELPVDLRDLYDDIVRVEPRAASQPKD